MLRKWGPLVGLLFLAASCSSPLEKSPRGPTRASPFSFAEIICVSLTCYTLQGDTYMRSLRHFLTLSL